MLEVEGGVQVLAGDGLYVLLVQAVGVVVRGDDEDRLVQYPGLVQRVYEVLHGEVKVHLAGDIGLCGGGELRQVLDLVLVAAAYVVAAAENVVHVAAYRHDVDVEGLAPDVVVHGVPHEVQVRGRQQPGLVQVYPARVRLELVAQVRQGLVPAVISVLPAVVGDGGVAQGVQHVAHAVGHIAARRGQHVLLGAVLHEARERYELPARRRGGGDGAVEILEHEARVRELVESGRVLLVQRPGGKALRADPHEVLAPEHAGIFVRPARLRVPDELVDRDQLRVPLVCDERVEVYLQRLRLGREHLGSGSRHGRRRRQGSGRGLRRGGGVCLRLAQLVRVLKGLGGVYPLGGEQAEAPHARLHDEALAVERGQRHGPGAGEPHARGARELKGQKQRQGQELPAAAPGRGAREPLPEAQPEPEGQKDERQFRQAADYPAQGLTPVARQRATRHAQHPDAEVFAEDVVVHGVYAEEQRQQEEPEPRQKAQEPPPAQPRQKAQQKARRQREQRREQQPRRRYARVEGLEHQLQPQEGQGKV